MLLPVRRFMMVETVRSIFYHNNSRNFYEKFCWPLQILLKWGGGGGGGGGGGCIIIGIMNITTMSCHCSCGHQRGWARD